MTTIKIEYQNSFKGFDLPALLSIGLSRPINRLFIILSLKSLLSFA